MQTPTDWSAFNARRLAALATCDEYQPEWRADAIKMAFAHASFGMDGGDSRESTWDNLNDTLQETGRLEWFPVVEHFFAVAWPATA